MFALCTSVISAGREGAVSDARGQTRRRARARRPRDRSTRLTRAAPGRAGRERGELYHSRQSQAADAVLTEQPEHTDLTDHPRQPEHTRRA